MTRTYLRDGRAPLPQKESTSRVMSANKAKDTGPELALRKELSALGVRGYRLHTKGVPGRPDIVFSKHKITVFIHGCFWHRCPHCKLKLPKSNILFWREKFARNKRRDKRKETELIRADWMVVTVWECQLNKNAKRVAKDLQATLLSRSV